MTGFRPNFDPSFLLLSVLPIRSTDSALKDLAAACGRGLHADSAVLLWHNPILARAELAVWHRAGPYARLHTDGDATPRAAERLLNEPLAWHPLRCGAETAGYLGVLPPAGPTSVPDEWVAVAGRLLQTVLAWERTLRERKLEALAEYAAGAGHEINNPLATITGRAAQLLKEETDPERRRLLETIGAQAYRVRDMIGDSMLFARPPEPQCEPTELCAAVDEVLSRFAGEIQVRRLRIEGDRSRRTPVFADPVQLNVVISELLRNAIEAVEDEGRIAVDCAPVQAPREEEGREWGRLRIRDDGPGLSELEREHCFDPFFSGRQAGRGLGFGLSKCWRIVGGQRGRMEVESSPEGTAFEVWLPAR